MMNDMKPAADRTVGKDFDPSVIRGIIFDYGGTLDSGGDHWSEIIWNGYVNAGVAVGKSEFRDAYVYAERELARVRHILPEHTFADMLLIKIRIELQQLVRQGLFAPQSVEVKAKEIADYCDASARKFTSDAKKVLDVLKPGYPMVLVSNFYGNIESVLREYGLDGYFSKIVESAVVGVRKPDPKIFSMGVEALGMQPSEVLVVGDSYRKDILPALAIGCQAVWIKGLPWQPADNAMPYNPSIDSLPELLLLLTKVN